MSDETREQLMDVNRDQSRRIAVLKNELNLMKGFRDGFYVKCTGYEKLLNDALAEVERLKELDAPRNADGDSIDDMRAVQERLKAELSKFQMSEFHPDYSLLEAARGVIEEQKQIIETAATNIQHIKDSVESRCVKALDGLGLVW